MRMTRLFAILPSLAVLASMTPARAEETTQSFGAVVVYGAPFESGSRAGASFVAPTQADVLELAVERCKANTVTAQWGNCAAGRWIDTGRYLVSAVVCDARDAGGEDHRLLEFMKDGVTASDEQIRDAVQRETPYAIADGGCRKVAVYDAARPDLSNQEEPGFARSVAKDPVVKR